MVMSLRGAEPWGLRRDMLLEVQFSSVPSRWMGPWHLPSLASGRWVSFYTFGKIGFGYLFNVFLFTRSSGLSFWRLDSIEV